LCLHVFGLGVVLVDCVCLLYCLWSSDIVSTLSLLNTIHTQHDLEKKEMMRESEIPPPDDLPAT
jgi:hypothetical protein